MDALSRALVGRVAALGARSAVPAIRSFELAPDARRDAHPGAQPGAQPGAGRNNFGFLRLVDGTIGLTYVALDGASAGLARALPGLELAGRSPLELLARFGGSTGWERALGLAAINAISARALAGRADVVAMPDNLDRLRPGPGERVGMVGHFARLVGPLRARGVPLTVVELDPGLVRAGPGFEVTLDPARLRGCAIVVITGTTLLNGTLGALLEHCRGAGEVHVLGPSASCLPDPLFGAGVTAVGGFRVTDPDLFTARWRAGGRWRDAGQRTLIVRDAWTGLDARERPGR